MTNSQRTLEVLRNIKKLALEYRRLAGRPLGITGEVAEFEAARILHLKLAQAGQAGYDAIETKNGRKRLLQIKGRCLLNNCKPGQRVGSIRIDAKWDAVLLVLLNQNYDALEIYEASRAAVIKVLTARKAKAMYGRSDMAIDKFKKIGKLRWPIDKKQRTRSKQAN